MTEARMQLTHEIVKTLTRTLRTRKETYRIIQHGNRELIFDPETKRTKPLIRKRLLAYFKKHYTTCEIRHKNGIVEITTPKSRVIEV